MPGYIRLTARAFVLSEKEGSESTTLIPHPPGNIMHTAMELVLSEKESSESMALVLSLHSPGTKIFTSTISSVDLVLSEKESSESTVLVPFPS